MKLTYLFVFVAISAFAGDDRFGVDTSFDQENASPDQNPTYVIPWIAASGASYVRDTLNWSLFETSPGVYAKSPYKQPWIDQIHAAGLKFVAEIQYPPIFYAGNTAIGPNENWPVAETAAFCAWLVQAEGSEISAIEVGNEWNNVTQFKGPPNGGSIANLQALVNMTAAVRAAVHAVAPNIPVIGLDEQGSEVTAMLAMKPAIDGVVYHPYGQGNQVPEQVYEPPFTDYAAWVKAVRAASTLPIWETERNADTSYNQYVTANWNARRLVESLGLGVAHTFIFQMIDSSTQAVLDYWINPTQTYYVLQRTIKALAGLKTIGSVATVLQSDAHFVPAAFYNYVFTGTQSNSPTACGVWFGGTSPQDADGHTPSTVTIQFPVKHQHNGGSAGDSLGLITGAEILDLVTGVATPIQWSQILNSTPASITISGIVVSDHAQLIIVL